MVVYQGEVLRGLMPEDFPNHPFEAIAQVGRTLVPVTVNNEEVSPNTFATELRPSNPCASIGRIGTFHLHELELGEVVVLPH